MSIKPDFLVPQGKLVAVGGSEDKTDDMEVLKAICELPEGGTKIVEIIPTASRQPAEAAAQYEEPFRNLGVETVGIMDIESRQDANREDFVARILAADVVFFTGGDQLRITNLLGGSAVLDTMMGHYQRGGVIAGTSAGAAAMSQAMIYQGKAGGAMRKGNVQMTPGLGLIRRTVVDSHFTQRGRFSRLLEVVTCNPGVIGLGLDEDSAAVVSDGHIVQAIGSGVVVIIDGQHMEYSNITQVSPGAAIAEHGVRVHTLTSGHSFDLETREYYPPEQTPPSDDYEDKNLDD
jgi:cyanophycinase